MDKKDSLITMRLTAKDKSKLKALAVSKGISISELANCAVKNFLDGPSNDLDNVLFKRLATLSDREEPEEKKQLLLRLTKSEWEAVNKQSSQFGYTKQRYIISLLRKNMVGSYLLMKSERDALVKSTVALNKIGVNLNQIAHALNILLGKSDGKSEFDVGNLKSQIVQLASFIKSHQKKVEQLLAEAKERRPVKL